MSHSRLPVIAVSLALLLGLTAVAFAQSTSSGTSTNGAVPTLINYNGVLKDSAGKALTSITGVTFLIYTDEQGGSPLWLETQNVTPDRSGHYVVQLGSTSASGLPADLFQSGEARWLAVQIAGQAEQPRIMLLSVPYAMKAGDAQTIGGLPPSAFVLAPANAGGNSSESSGANASSGSTGSGVSNTVKDVTTTGGTVSTIPLFATAADIQNSLLTQTGKTAINVTGALDLPALGTATSSAGFDSQPQDFVASSFNSSTGSAENQTFQWQAEPTANDTANPSGTLNLLYGLGTTAPSETGLNIASTGIITFATGQTFPGTGTGTITGVTAGTGLSGGGTSGTVTLTNTGLLSVTAGSGITSTGGQTPTIANSGILSITAGTGINTSGGQSPTLSINTSVVPELSTANTFTGNLSTKGELAAGGTAGGKIANGTVEVDAGVTNTGTLSPGLNFGGGGEAIASDRTGTVNKFGLDFYTNNQNHMSLTNGGNLGIGTTAPTHLLEVDGSASTTTAQMAMVSAGTDAAISVKNTNTANGGREYWIDSGSGAAGIGAGNFAVYDVTAGITRFVIGPTGNVGIGTISPGAPLDVVSSSANSIYASDSATTTAAIYGGATATSGAAWGVEGVTASGDDAYGVFGVATSGTGRGVYGQYSSTQSYNGGQLVNNSIGVFGDAGLAGTSGIGVAGTADDAIAGLFQNSSAEAPTLDVTAGDSEGYMFFASNFPNNTSCTIDQNADLSCSGKIGAVVPVDGGSRQLAVVGIASPKNWFEDFGSGQLVNGVAVITLDPDFVQTVNTEMDYKVFPVPNGDCKGLYVTHKTATSFEVRELGGGTSNVAFDYRITALRKNYESVRFADQTAKLQKHREMEERMRAGRGNGQSHDPQRNLPLRPSSPQAELRPAEVK